MDNVVKEKTINIVIIWGTEHKKDMGEKQRIMHNKGMEKKTEKRDTKDKI